MYTFYIAESPNKSDSSDPSPNKDNEVEMEVEPPKNEKKKAGRYQSAEEDEDNKEEAKQENNESMQNKEAVAIDVQPQKEVPAKQQLVGDIDYVYEPVEACLLFDNSALKSNYIMN